MKMLRNSQSTNTKTMNNYTITFDRIDFVQNNTTEFYLRVKVQGLLWQSPRLNQRNKQFREWSIQFVSNNNVEAVFQILEIKNKNQRVRGLKTIVVLQGTYTVLIADENIHGIKLAEIEYTVSVQQSTINQQLSGQLNSYKKNIPAIRQENQLQQPSQYMIFNGYNTQQQQYQIHQELGKLNDDLNTYLEQKKSQNIMFTNLVQENSAFINQITDSKPKNMNQLKQAQSIRKLDIPRQIKKYLKFKGRRTKFTMNNSQSYKNTQLQQKIPFYQRGKPDQPITSNLTILYNFTVQTQIKPKVLTIYQQTILGKSQILVQQQSQNGHQYAWKNQIQIANKENSCLKVNINGTMGQNLTGIIDFQSQDNYIGLTGTFKNQDIYGIFNWRVRQIKVIETRLKDYIELPSIKQYNQQNSQLDNSQKGNNFGLKADSFSQSSLSKPLEHYGIKNQSKIEAVQPWNAFPKKESIQYNSDAGSFKNSRSKQKLQQSFQKNIIRTKERGQKKINDIWVNKNQLGRSEPGSPVISAYLNPRQALNTAFIDEPILLKDNRFRLEPVTINQGEIYQNNVHIPSNRQTQISQRQIPSSQYYLPRSKTGQIQIQKPKKLMIISNAINRTIVPDNIAHNLIKNQKIYNIQNNQLSNGLNKQVDIKQQDKTIKKQQYNSLNNNINNQQFQKKFYLSRIASQPKAQIVQPINSSIGLLIHSISIIITHGNILSGKYVSIQMDYQQPYLTQTISCNNRLIWKGRGFFFKIPAIPLSENNSNIVVKLMEQNQKKSDIIGIMNCPINQLINDHQTYRGSLTNNNLQKIGQVIIGLEIIQKHKWKLYKQKIGGSSDQNYGITIAKKSPKKKKIKTINTQPQLNNSISQPKYDISRRNSTEHQRKKNINRLKSVEKTNFKINQNPMLNDDIQLTKKHIHQKFNCQTCKNKDQKKNNLVMGINAQKKYMQVINKRYRYD